jgi:hypothetical protein
MLSDYLTERGRFLLSLTVNDHTQEIHDPVCNTIPVSCATGMRQFIGNAA